MIRRLFWRWVSFAILAAGICATAVRFAGGLGAATNLSDQMPWGLWVGFDVLCGVGLAAGGFAITTAVYILHLHQLRPIVRPAVVTAFLGYLLVIVALIYDLGRPWNIWRAAVMWNPRSVMFEVAWCVMLYTTVLALEFSPLLFDKLGWRKASRAARSAIVPLAAAGFILSTLHQSSLGGLYLILPTKMHPLWYSPLLPWLFWFSAVAGGVAMVIFESGLSGRAFGRALELDVLEQLAKVAVVFVGLFLFLRWWDLASRGQVRAALAVWGTGSLPGRMFWLEQLLFAVPAALALSIRWRRSPQRLFGVACAMVGAFLVHRLNVSTTALAAGLHYFPSWMEIAVTLMLATLGVAAFRFTVLHLPVFECSGCSQLSDEHPVQAGYA